MFENQSFIAALINFSLLRLDPAQVRQAADRGLPRDAPQRDGAEHGRRLGDEGQGRGRLQGIHGALAQLDQELAKLRSDIERAAEEDKQRILAEAEENARR